MVDHRRSVDVDVNKGLAIVRHCLDAMALPPPAPGFKMAVQDLELQRIGGGGPWTRVTFTFKYRWEKNDAGLILPRGVN